MQSDELDDLFRQELDGHASAPSPDLWARLQARTAAEATPGATDTDPLDAQFRAGLMEHATPPRRELWERLEDEYLRPRQRRRPVVAWGRLAVAASLLLVVLAGGAGLWLRGRSSATGPLATPPATATTTATSRPAAGPAGQPATQAAQGNLATAHPRAAATWAASQAAPTAVTTRQPLAPLVATATMGREKKGEFFASQATGPAALPSSSPVASAARLHRSTTAQPAAPRLPRTNPQPDVAAGSQAHLGQHHAPQPGPPAPAPAVVAAATLAPTEAQVIEVEVRHGGGEAARPAPAVVAAAPTGEPAPTRRPRLHLGGLLRQADHLVHGEAVSLAEATTDLPESVTVQARLGGRVLSKTIQL